MAESASPVVVDRDVLTLEQLYDFLGLDGAERTPAAIEEVPFFTLCNGAQRWLRDQVITWAARGGQSPRPQRRARMLRVREDA